MTQSKHMIIFQEETWVQRPLNETFSFFNTPKNLSKLMPSFMKFTLITPEPIVMKEGAIFDYKIKLFGMPMRWQSYISYYNPPYQFVDIQLKGPHDYWHHEHSFSEQNGGTMITDRVSYRMPLGSLGSLADKIIVSKINQRLFKHRDAFIKDHFQDTQLD